ncbi:hypothetical protein SISSUDRAFT_1059858 [Sistotremastrum suecicum HHB10207 ss-3]|uniref:Uncharacterized protein n=1 Tax=Sistotremastrum suecicum HHB10207 ss-3 TaxID=1314776 RepID=A0A166FSY5_9AGAM|nr:hypothetical protein SISSUDRAFT_1059858 [Sistotremastrum suecicum HHB10207 ss-3]
MAKAPASQSLQVDTSILIFENPGYHDASIMNSEEGPISELQSRTPSPTSFIDFDSDEEDDEDSDDNMLSSSSVFKWRMPPRMELEFQSAANELPVDMADEDLFQSESLGFPGDDQLGYFEELHLEDPFTVTEVVDHASLGATMDAAEGEASSRSSIVEPSSLHPRDDETSQVQFQTDKATDPLSSDMPLNPWLNDRTSLRHSSPGISTSLINPIPFLAVALATPKPTSPLSA